MMVYWIPKCFPDLLEWNKSYALLSELFDNLWDLKYNTVLLSFKEALFVFIRIKIVGFFNSKPSSSFRLLISLIVLWRTMKKSWRPHSNFLEHWLRSKQRTYRFVVDLYSFIYYLFSSVNLIQMRLFQVNTCRKRFIIWWLM